MSEHKYDIASLDELHQSSDEDPWLHRWRGFELLRHELALEVIHEHTKSMDGGDGDSAILDIGCSTGEFSVLLTNLYARVQAVDISPTAIRRAQNRYSVKGLTFCTACLPGSNLPHGTYDMITCLEVLYYQDEKGQKELLMEICDLLKPCGQTVISSKIGPNPYFTPDRLRQIIGEYFNVVEETVYGWNLYAGLEKRLFQIHHFLYKTEKVLKYRKVVTSDREISRKEKLVFQVSKVPLLREVLIFFSKTASTIVKYVLKWRLPAQIAHHLARRFNLTPTHVFMVASNRFF